jgi:hypothetical protein
MKKVFIFLSVLFLSKIQFGQRVNLIIEVNDKLILDGLSAVHLVFYSGTDTQTVAVDYIPGELTLPEETWNLIQKDTSVKFTLHFDYNTFIKNQHQIAHFYVGLSRHILEQRYVIINIFDFREKNYRRWYQWHTDKNFLAELTYPNSGKYIRKR